MNKINLLREIQMLDFTLQEISLFLDLNPNEKEALCVFNDLKKQLCHIKNEYECNYGLLTNRSNTCKEYRSYIGNKWPWEKEVC